MCVWGGGDLGWIRYMYPNIHRIRIYTLNLTSASASDAALQIETQTQRDITSALGTCYCTILCGGDSNHGCCKGICSYNYKLANSAVRFSHCAS